MSALFRSSWSPVLVGVPVLGLSLFAAACASADPAPPPAPEAASEQVLSAPADLGDDASTLDGVYTTAQAQRGARVFEGICSECHESTDWQEESFLERWNDESVYRFWYYIYERMPHGDPYTLTREQVTDVLTYILSLNGLPAGEAELGTDDDSLDDYWLRWGER